MRPFPPSTHSTFLTQGVTFVSKIERMLADYDTQDVALAGPLADLNLALDAPPASALAATRPSRLRRLHSFEPMVGGLRNEAAVFGMLGAGSTSSQPLSRNHFRPSLQVLTDGSWPKSGVPFLHPPRLPPDLDWYRSTFETVRASPSLMVDGGVAANERCSSLLVDANSHPRTPLRPLCLQAYTVNTKKKLKWLWDAGRMEVNYRPLPPPPPAEGASSSSAAPAAAAGGRGGAADVRTLQCGTLAGLVLAWLAEAPGEEYPLAQAVADLGLSEEHTIRVVATLTIGVGVLTYKGAPPPPPGARPRKPKPDDVLVVAPGFRPAKHVRDVLDVLRGRPGYDGLLRGGSIMPTAPALRAPRLFFLCRSSACPRPRRRWTPPPAARPLWRTASLCVVVPRCCSAACHSVAGETATRIYTR